MAKQIGGSGTVRRRDSVANAADGAGVSPIRPTIFEDVPWITAAFSTRHGGVSSGAHASLNLGLNTGDADVNVRINRTRFLNALGFDREDVALGGQVHGNRVALVDRPGHLEGYDGLVTRTPGIGLCILAADCAAVLLVDVEERIIGACHAGWRGAVSGVVDATVHMMLEVGARVENLRAYIAPCISVRHFEVGEEVAEQFDAEFVRRGDGSTRPHVDLRGQLAKQLRSLGVAGHHVEASAHCTFADSERFFSYRRDGKASGRMFGLIGIRT